MVKVNPHFAKLSTNYLFSDLEKKIALFKEKEPEMTIINFGLGDVTKPLPPTLLASLCNASQEMGDRQKFRGYGPSQGYPFLREAIAYGEYRSLGISSDEIFVSNGAKCDLATLQELFSLESQVAILDPTYPVYLDTTIMAGRMSRIDHGDDLGIHAIPCNEENSFNPLPPSIHTDIIYLASPNNPTGTVLDRRTMREWVNYAIEHRSVIIFDGAYEAYISSDSPKSIYEIDGAKEVVVEVRSFSKTAGFTGLRCSYCVIPKELLATLNGSEVSIHSLWRRRQDTKFGGVPYPVQKCAAAYYTPAGRKEVQEILRIYQDRARFLLDGLKKSGYTVYGGIDSPYVWCKTPKNLGSIQFFNLLLERLHIVTTPGDGFGKHGEGFIRFSAFAEPSQLAEGLLRIKKLF